MTTKQDSEKTLTRLNGSPLPDSTGQVTRAILEQAHELLPKLNKLRDYHINAPYGRTALAQQLVSVQPLQGPSGMIFYRDNWDKTGMSKDEPSREA